MSCEDFMMKFDEMVKRFKQEFHEIVENERAKIKAEVEAYQAEKEKMSAISVRDDDIIHLNVGGQKFTTTRSTLCQVEGSLLASMFSGRWEDSVVRDQDGAVFFDFDPQYFGLILSYLRTKKIATSENPTSLPNVPKSQVKDFNVLVEYLGLSDEILPPETFVSEKFNLHSPGITLEEEEKVAVHDSGGEHKYVLGDNVYKDEVVNLKLKLESFQSNHWMLIGIVKADVVPLSDNSYCWTGSYGWALGNSGQLWKNGSCTVDHSLGNLTKQHDTVELVLNCCTGRLTLNLPIGQEFNMDVPKSQTWKLHVNLCSANDKIRIMKA